MEASPGAPTLRSPSRRDSFCCADPPRARDRPQCSWKFSKVRVLVYFLSTTEDVLLLQYRKKVLRWYKLSKVRVLVYFLGTTEDVLLIQYRKRVSRWYKFSIVSARARERPECWNKFSKVGVLEHFLCRTYPGTLTFENCTSAKILCGTGAAAHPQWDPGCFWHWWAPVYIYIKMYYKVQVSTWWHWWAPWPTFSKVIQLVYLLYAATIKRDFFFQNALPHLGLLSASIVAWPKKTAKLASSWIYYSKVVNLLHKSPIERTFVNCLLPRVQISSMSIGRRTAWSPDTKKQNSVLSTCSMQEVTIWVS